MRLRSLLFVPGDRPERFDKAAATGADALILDLEDSVSANNKSAAREAIAARLMRERTGPLLFVRVNPLDSGFFEQDFLATLPGGPDGYVLPKAEGAHSIEKLSGLLAERSNGTIRILPIATETPASLFRLGEYSSVRQHLCGITWGAEDLPAAVGAVSAREEDGRYTPPYELARSLTLFAAAAADVPPIETVYPAFRDLEGLAGYAARARRDGFTGMMAIHPDQVPVINQAFTPSGVEIDNARAIVAAFKANPGAGALQLNGKMIDAPHLKQALRILGDG